MSSALIDVCTSLNQTLLTVEHTTFPPSIAASLAAWATTCHSLLQKAERALTTLTQETQLEKVKHGLRHWLHNVNHKSARAQAEGKGNETCDAMTLELAAHAKQLEEILEGWRREGDGDDG